MSESGQDYEMTYKTIEDAEKKIRAEEAAEQTIAPAEKLKEQPKPYDGYTFDYYCVLSGNILSPDGLQIVGSCIISSAVLSLTRPLTGNFKEINQLVNTMWEQADPSMKAITNRKNVHLTFFERLN